MMESRQENKSNFRELSFDKFRISFPIVPEFHRALDKYCPRQNDVAKSLVSIGLQLESQMPTAKNIIVGGGFEPSQLNMISSFFSEESSVQGIFLNRKRILRWLKENQDFPSLFAYCSREAPVSCDLFRMLSLSLNKHSTTYGSELLQRTYESCKNFINTSNHKFSERNLIVEEKFGKLNIIGNDTVTLKDRVKFFSKTGLNWSNHNSDEPYFENGWSIGSFAVDGPDSKHKSSIEVVAYEFSVVTDPAPSIKVLSDLVGHITEWISQALSQHSSPGPLAIHYTVPSVPIVGWMMERFDTEFKGKIEHVCNSLLWGWHPTADLLEFLADSRQKTAVLVDFEDYPRISVTFKSGDAT